MASVKKDSGLPPGFDFRPTGNTTPTTIPGGVKPGDLVVYPALSRKGLAPGKFYLDSKTGDVYQVARPGFKDILFLSGKSKKSDNKEENTTTTVTPTTVTPKTNDFPNKNVLKFLESKLAEAKAAYDPFDPVKRPSGIDEPSTVLYDGKNINKNSLRKVINDLQKQVNTITKAAKSLDEKAVAIREEIATDENYRQRNAPGVRLTPAQIKQKENQAKTIEDQAKQIRNTGNTTVKVAPTTTTTTTTPTTTTQPPTTTTTAPATTPTTTPGATTTTTPGATTTTTTPKSTTTTVPAATPATPAKPSTGTPLMNNLQNPSSRNNIGATPSGSSGGGGGTGGGGGGSTTTGSGKNNKKNTKDKLAPAVDYEALKVQFPQYAWILDLDPQYNDLKKITVDVINGPENGGITQERWNELAPGTSWFMDKATIAASRRVRNRFGDIPFANGGFSKLVSDTMNQKYDDATLDTAFYGEAFRRDPITGNYVNDAAAKTVLRGTAANKYRTYAKNMFSNVSDDTIVSLLTGEKTVEDFDRTLRTVAKNVYGNLAQQLDDPSMDMATIVRPWQEHAAKVLEMDPSEIDMTLPQFQIAYSGNTENGQTKALSIGEWNQKLRTDSIYNWKNTNTAKQGARELAFNLASAFGKII